MRPLVLLLMATACRTPEAVTGPARTPTPAEEDGARGVTDPDLRAILASHWEWNMAVSPVWATTLGDHRFDDRIGDNSLETLQSHRRVARRFLAQAQAIPRERLSAGDRATLDLFVETLEAGIRSEVCAFEEWTIAISANPVTTWNTLPDKHKIENARDAANYLARVRALPRVIDQEVEHLRRGLAAGRVAPAEVVRRVVDLVRGQVEEPIEKWPLLGPLRARYAFLPPEYAAELIAAVADGVRPALARYLTFVEGEVLPKARSGDRVGLVGLPDGAACYASQIRANLALDKSPADLHALGIAELDRIHADMRVLGKKLFGTEDLATIFERLRTDPALHFRTAEEVEAKAKSALAKAKARMPEWFGILPKADCVVVRIPDYEAPYTTVAYYRQPHPDGSKPGEYFINVYAPETRPSFEAEVLAFHESIPGHHLQIAIAFERSELPAFRRHADFTAYIEGWALYTERLAEEMGLYSGDVDRMGMLSYDSWRASRLVVDTGIHAMGWTRERAIRYMMENTPLAKNNIENEVDRYIGWPAQALGYKVGQLEILRLRRLAETELGARFDRKGFHDVVLGGGAVTLPMLEANVKAWIESRR